jgi:hypothetical protein
MAKRRLHHLRSRGPFLLPGTHSLAVLSRVGVMRDYVYEDPDGRHQYVADMPLAAIHELLASGVETVPGEDGPTPTPEAVLERLRVELVVRSLGDG